MRMLRLSCVIAFVGALTLLGTRDGRANFVNQQLVCDGANANSGTITTKDSGGTVRTFDLNITSTAQCAAVKAASTAAVATDPSLVIRINPGDAVATNIAALAASAATTATNTGAPIPTQAPTIDIGAAGISQTTVGTTNAVSLKYLNTTAVDSNSGTKSAGTLRVVLATDQPALTNKILVTPDSVALPANQSVNESQINGVTPLMGNGVSGTGSQRVNISSDNTAFPVNAQFGGTALVADPCQANTATIKPISITSNTTTNIVTGTSAKKLYVCYMFLKTTAANNVAVISGTTGATCGANTAALVGGTTAANGLNDAANDGQAFGNGSSSIMQVLTNNDDICIITSAATPLAGVIKYVVQ